MMRQIWFWLEILLGLLVCCFAEPKPSAYVPANAFISWNNSALAYNSVNTGSTRVNIILLNGRESFDFGAVFAFGFHRQPSNSYFLAILIVYSFSYSRQYGGIYEGREPTVVWSANRNHPVGAKATLELTKSGFLLKDSDGTLIWSTKTKSVIAAMNLTEMGNLVLLDKSNTTIWQSFDHPTDTLLYGQKLKEGMELISNASPQNWTEGLYSFSITHRGPSNALRSSPPQLYYNNSDLSTFIQESPSKTHIYAAWSNGTFAYYFANDSGYVGSIYIFSVPRLTMFSFIKLEHTGNLLTFHVRNSPVGYLYNTNNLLTTDDCGYPTFCGKYGVCKDSQCTCPGTGNGTKYFEQIDPDEPKLGCQQITNLFCEKSQVHLHKLLELRNISFTSYIEDKSNHENIDSERCKQACLKNCSCKAAFFQYGSNLSFGYCYFLPEVYTIKNITTSKTNFQGKYNNSIAYIKVVDATHLRKRRERDIIISGCSIGAIFILFFLGITLILFRKKINTSKDKADYIEQLPGIPTRYSFQEVKSMTQNFSKKLGEGGFASVFEGSLSDGIKVAVKRLDDFRHMKKSFLAEVQTIGRIHNVHLVRLMGFCVDKSHMMLIYEFMDNCSLDRWIFNKSLGFVLDWQQRKKIILDIAKGLKYLHEDCSHKILHLDIKPQNILLDINFNAKVSDFGLSKLIDKDQSKVVTTLKGTLGYLAPEWLSSVITEKVDVYSFGILMLETLCGRRNFDATRPEDEKHLLALLKIKFEEEKLLDLIDNKSGQETEVVKMMSLAAWCLQTNYSKRPSMSVVVKVLEGSIDLDENHNYRFSNINSANRSANVGECSEVEFTCTSTPPLPSIVSGPR